MQQLLGIVEVVADLAEDVNQVRQLLVVRRVEGQLNYAADFADDKFAASSREGQGMVGAADTVVDCGVVQGKVGDCLHDADQLAASEDWILTAGAADAGAGQGRLDFFQGLVVVEASGVLMGRCRDLEWAEATFCHMVLHDLLILRLQSWSCWKRGAWSDFVRTGESTLSGALIRRTARHSLLTNHEAFDPADFTGNAASAFTLVLGG